MTTARTTITEIKAVSLHLQQLQSSSEKRIRPLGSVGNETKTSLVNAVCDKENQLFFQ